MKELICIVCPKGCHLKVDDNMGVSGNSCEKGVEYAVNELTNPVRVVTSTVKIEGNPDFVRLPVKTNSAIKKGMIFEVMNTLDKAVVKSPIFCGDVVIKNILNTGADIVATRDM